MGHRRAPSALMLLLLSVGPPNHTTSKWDQISSRLWGMPTEWGLRNLLSLVVQLQALDPLGVLLNAPWVPPTPQAAIAAGLCAHRRR